MLGVLGCLEGMCSASSGGDDPWTVPPAASCVIGIHLTEGLPELDAGDHGARGCRDPSLQTELHRLAEQGGGHRTSQVREER